MLSLHLHLSVVVSRVLFTSIFSLLLKSFEILQVEDLFIDTATVIEQLLAEHAEFEVLESCCFAL